MVRISGTDNDVRNILNVHGSAVTRGHQEQTYIGYALQSLASQHRPILAVHTEITHLKRAVGV